MHEKVIYKDRLVVITPDSIYLKNYYFPGTSKRVSFDNINSIAVEHASPSTGKWRIWGTRDFTTWYPLDIFRPKRDEIFLMSLVGKKVRIGFTTENSETVRHILEEKKVCHGVTAVH
ncbi:MAG: hypothetical protein WBZ48_10195 [Bacteroidota bacterium]